jgi:hypothetical protein
VQRATLGRLVPQRGSSTICTFRPGSSNARARADSGAIGTGRSSSNGQARHQHRLAPVDLLARRAKSAAGRRRAAPCGVHGPRASSVGMKSFAVPNEDGFGRHAVDG